MNSAKAIMATAIALICTNGKKFHSKFAFSCSLALQLSRRPNLESNTHV